VLVDGAPASTYQWHGETYVLGQKGDRYTLRIVNHSERRIEAVASIDGRDVVDGKPADFQKRGYLVPAWGSVDIDGWRLSESEAAAFRFSAVADSYAARTGSAREVGVVGVAIFPERVRPPRPIYRPSYPHVPYGGRSYDDRAPMAERGASKSKGAPADQPLSDLSGGAAARSAAPAPTPSAMAEADASPRESSRSRGESERRNRPGLGTEFGETVASDIQEVSFVRASSSPAAVLGARYNDRSGLLALGIDLGGQDDLDLRESATPFPAEHHYAHPPVGWRPSSPVRY